MKTQPDKLTALTIAKTKLAVIRGIVKLAKNKTYVEHSLIELITIVLDAGISPPKEQPSP